MIRLDPDQMATLTAVVERIIPTDHDAGARDAGTIAYVLERASDDAMVAALYRDLADRLDKSARATAVATLFARLPVDEQDRLLGEIDPADTGLQAVVVHAMEGFYGDPRHGGNRDAVSWRMLAFPGPTSPRGYEAPLGWYDATTPIDPEDQL